MKKLYFFIIFVFSLQFSNAQTWLKYPRVKKAYTEKASKIDSMIATVGIYNRKVNILIVGYKLDKDLVIYAKKPNESVYDSLTTYKFCVLSGNAGPKRYEGDGQVPEGLYHISYFNPYSNFYLSMKINYPNKSDNILKTGTSAGGQIFIHGNCVSIGCIPITDDKIKELYILAMFARDAGQSRIPVYLFPTRMTEKNMKNLKEQYPEYSEFWTNLQPAYDYFSNNHKAIRFSIDNKGKYIIYK